MSEVTRDAKDAHAFEARAAASEVKAGKTRDVLRMKFVGADASASVAGVEELPGRSNYFKGADSAKWQADVRAYARVRYAGIYPGVDLEYYGNQSRLEYDFRLAPGADPRAVRLSFEGARSVRVDASSGDLVLRVGAREVRQHAPVAYQEFDGARREVASRFRLARGGREVGFEVGEYDASQPLVIDPTVSLAYGAFVGGNGVDTARGIALDAQGNAWISGTTTSIDFPATSGAPQASNGDAGVFSDAFVAELNAAGDSVLYATYLGGNQGDEGAGIALDSSGNVYLAGTTTSPNFPVTPDAVQPVFGGAFISGAVRSDAFAAKLDLSRPSASALLYSTYLGGAGGSDGASAIAVGPTGDIYLTGSTGSPDFPITCTGVPATYRGGPFISRIDPSTPGPDGLVYSSFFSGTSGADAPFAITLDPSGNVYLAGSAYSSDFPSTPGGYRNPTGESGTNAFVSKLDQVRRADCNGDKTAPTVSCGSADGAWHAADVQIACAATDGGSGLLNGGDSSFSLSTAVPAGTEDSNASTGSRQVCDGVGNCTSAGPVTGNRVDKKGPTITINSPTATGYSLGTSVAASYTCADAGSGVATCVGTVSSGSAIDTSSFGAKTFTVTATDNVGNISTRTVTYSVAYNVCLDYNPQAIHPAGSTLPVKLHLCDPNGNNLSSPNIVVQAVGVGLVMTTVYGDVYDSGDANPDGNFRYAGGFYIFNMSTKGLGTGGYYLYFTVGSDPTLHTAPFQLK